MLSKKVKEYKRVQRESEIALQQSQVLLSGLRKSLKKNFQDNLRIKIRLPMKVRFGQFDFGLKKNNQDAAIIYLLSVNDAYAALDNEWVDEHGEDASRAVPVSVQWIENFCLEQSEKLGIDIRLSKR